MTHEHSLFSLPEMNCETLISECNYATSSMLINCDMEASMLNLGITKKITTLIFQVYIISFQYAFEYFRYLLTLCPPRYSKTQPSFKRIKIYDGKHGMEQLYF